MRIKELLPRPSQRPSTNAGRAVAGKPKAPRQNQGASASVEAQDAQDPQIHLHIIDAGEFRPLLENLLQYPAIAPVAGRAGDGGGPQLGGDWDGETVLAAPVPDLARVQGPRRQLARRR